MKWISIKDKKPKQGQNVIAVGTWWGEICGAAESEHMGLGSWSGEGVSIDSDSYATEIKDVTHWMPIPEHPITNGE